MLQRIALQAHGMFAVATSYLAGNALGRVIPGGGAAAGALQFRMLVQAGLPAASVASGLTVSALLTLAVLLALPVMAVPAILAGAPVAKGLARAAYLGAGIFVLVFVAGLVLFVADGPLVWVGRMAQRVRNRLMRRRAPLSGLPGRLLDERDLIARVIGRRWWEALLFSVGKWGLDYATLVAALAAVGATPRPVARAARLLRVAGAGADPDHARRPRVRGGGADRHARAGRRVRVGCRAGDARLPAGVLLAADARRARGLRAVSAPLRRRGPTAPSGGG